MKRRKYNAQRFCFANNFRIEQQCLEPPHIRFIDIFAKDRDATLFMFRQTRKRFVRDRVDFRDDTAGVRLDHLCAIAEVDFVTVVMRWIMARRDHYTCARPDVTHSK